MSNLFYPYAQKEDMKRLGEWLSSVGFNYLQDGDSHASLDYDEMQTVSGGTDAFILKINPLFLNDRKLFSSIVNKALKENPGRRLTELKFMEEKADDAYSDSFLMAEVKTANNVTLGTIRDDSSGLPVIDNISVEIKIKDSESTVIKNFMSYEDKDLINRFEEFKNDFKGIIEINSDTFRIYVEKNGGLPDIKEKCLSLTFTCTLKDVSCPPYVKEEPFDLLDLLFKNKYFGEKLKPLKGIIDMSKYEPDDETMSSERERIKEFKELDDKNLINYLKSAFQHPALIVKKSNKDYDNLYDAITSLVLKQESLKVFFSKTMNVDNKFSLALNPFFSKFKLTAEDGFARICEMSGSSKFKKITQGTDFGQKRMEYHTHILASVFTNKISKILYSQVINQEVLYQELLAIVKQEPSHKPRILTDERIKEIREALEKTINSIVLQPEKQPEKQPKKDSKIDAYIKYDHDKRVATSLIKFLDLHQGNNVPISITDEAKEVKKMMLHTNSKQKLDWRTVNMDYLILSYYIGKSLPTSEGIKINDAENAFDNSIKKINKITFDIPFNTKTTSNIRKKHLDLLEEFNNSVLYEKSKSSWAEAWIAIVLYDSLITEYTLLEKSKGLTRKYLLYNTYLQLKENKQFKEQKKIWESDPWLKQFAEEPQKEYHFESPKMPMPLDEKSLVMQRQANAFAKTDPKGVLSLEIEGKAPQK